MKWPGLFLVATLIFLAPSSRAGDHAPDKYFDDPTKRTAAEMRAEIHWRAERGISCYLEGRCRFPNSYMYDRKISARVKKTLVTDSRFWNSSIWTEGYRRWVVLKACATSQKQLELNRPVF